MQYWGGLSAPLKIEFKKLGIWMGWSHVRRSSGLVEKPVYDHNWRPNWTPSVMLQRKHFLPGLFICTQNVYGNNRIVTRQIMEKSKLALKKRPCQWQNLNWMPYLREEYLPNMWDSCWQDRLIGNPFGQTDKTLEIGLCDSNSDSVESTEWMTLCPKRNQS